MYLNSHSSNDYYSRHFYDKRYKKDIAMTLDQVFYVVHHVSIGDKDWYHTSLIAADSEFMFIDAVEDIVKVVAKSIGYTGVVNESSHESLLVHPIFIRNLQADHKEFVTPDTVNKISKMLSDAINAESDLLSYLVLGYHTGEEHKQALVFHDVKAINALRAIDRLIVASQSEMKCDFIPLFSTIKAPVTAKLFDQYNQSAKHIRDFVTSRIESVGQIH